jgi:hypothetical protein
MFNAMRILTSTALLSVAVTVIGCDNNENPAPAPTPPAAPAPVPQATTPPPPTADPTMTDPAQNATPATPPGGATAAATDATTAEATTLMDQTVQYVKENKWDLADASMKKLDAIKDQLPESLKPRYAQVKTMYDTAKVGKSISVPGM